MKEETITVEENGKKKKMGIAESNTNIKFPQSPETTALFPFQMTFEWLTPLMLKGAFKPLKMADLFDVEPQNKVTNLSKIFEENWKKNKNVTKEKLLWTLCQMFWWDFVWGGILSGLAIACVLCQPLFLREILGFLDNQSAEWWEGYMWGMSLFSIQLLQTLFMQHSTHIMAKLGLNVKGLLRKIIFTKTLKLSNAARQSHSSGELVNLISVDCEKIGMVLMFIHYSWSGLIQIAISVVFLLYLLGWPILVGFGFALLTLPIQMVMGKLMEVYTATTLGFTDKRIKGISEFLNGIQIIKFFSWEESFYTRIMKIRKLEIIEIFKSKFAYGILLSVMGMTPVGVSLVTFSTYSLIGWKLTPEIIFPSIAFINILQFPLTFFPLVVAFIVQSLVSLRRLEVVLLKPDVEELKNHGNYDTPVIVENGDFEWEGKPTEKKKTKKRKKSKKKNQKKKIQKTGGKEKKKESSDDVEELKDSSSIDEVGKLKGINFTLKKGETLCVVGKVGSGKSSLVQCLLGEMKQTKGSVKLSGSVAYCPQQAWIQNCTAKENILFGKEYDKDRYYHTIKVCALVKDFELMAAGDETEIGERGINLSGGQRQRLSIARAVYSNQDIILLDDPLSAVDAHVGKHLFEECIMKELKSKTTVFVTHQLQYMKRCDRIIVMDDGKIDSIGTYAEHMKKGGLLKKLVDKYLAKEEKGEEDQVKKKVKKKKKKKENNESNAKIIQTEEVSSGTFSLLIIWKYIMGFGGPVFVFGLFLVFALSRAAQIGANWWVSQWSANVYPTFTLYHYLAIYAGIALLSSLCSWVKNFLFTLGSLFAANRFFKDAFYRLIRAPMSFFESTPTGRILNRFSKDQEIVDVRLPQVLLGVLDPFLSVCGTFIVISIVTWQFLFALVPLCLFYMAIHQFYSRNARQLKRLDSTSRSPLYSHFSESITGISTIRAFKLEETFTKKNSLMVDYNQIPNYIYFSSQRWIGLRLEGTSAFVVFFATLFALLSKGTISSAFIGLSLTYALQVSQMLNYTVQQAAEAESSLTSVERLDYYSRNIENEAPSIISENRPEKGWPKYGKVEFKDYKLRYRKNLPLVLKGVDLIVNPGEKIGICGRTGAGKSSLMLALFRIVEPAGGSIIIDGVDITKIGLDDLRRKISIIPQEPIMFADTVRFNLDPFNEASDKLIWDSLEKANLKQVIEKLDKKLDFVVSEGGDNFSVGQRQLFCLARALLKKTRILILDEATASVDFETDEIIQKTVKKYFAESTILTIAHRLNTIIDYDKILVMNDGKVSEFDKPSTLIQNESSELLSMIKETGKQNSKMLIDIALQGVILDEKKMIKSIF